ncbi:MAG: hypothetical protein WBZ45_09190 [Acidimicrobiia bacterium]
MNRLTALLPIVPFLALALWFGTRSRVFFGAFLIGHALVHAMYFVPEPPAHQTSLEWPFHLDRSWLLSGYGISVQAIRLIGGVLAVVAVVGFVGAGIGLFANAGWWAPAGVVSAVASLLLLGAYLQPLLALGLIINIVVLSVVLFGWPELGYLNQ